MQSIFNSLLPIFRSGKKWRSHPRLAILGTVEARMQSADLVILGGLNEGIWPPAPDTSPWINQEIRGALGLRTGTGGQGYQHMIFSCWHIARILSSHALKQQMKAPQLPADGGSVLRPFCSPPDWIGGYTHDCQQIFRQGLRGWYQTLQARARCKRHACAIGASTHIMGNRYGCADI